jgi:peptide/nickel transport system substrate-binding protein
MSVTRRQFFRRSGAAATSAVLAAAARRGSLWPGRLAEAAAAGPNATGGFVLAQASEFHEMNPHRELWSDDSNLQFAMFDSLIQRDDSMGLVPVLAESYTNVSPLEWLFTLRRGVKFHNGEPLTAATIAWNVRDALRTDIKRDVTWQAFDRVEIVNDLTFKLITKRPDPVLRQRLVRFFILPQQYYERVGEQGFIDKPVGTGPYRFVERVPDSHVKLEAFDEYWGANAHLRNVLFRIIPDAATRVSSLLAGEVDLVLPLASDQVKTLNQNPGTKVADVTSDRMVYIQFWPESPKGGHELRDTRVRQAINYAVNVDAIIRFVLGGLSTRIPTLFPPATFAYDQSLKPYPYDPDKARSLLRAAGLPNGFSINMEVPPSTIVPATVEVSEAIVGYLGKVGIKVNLKVLELGTMVKLGAAKQIAPIFFWSWGTDFLDPEPALRGFLYTKSPYAFFGKREWDQMIDTAAAEMNPSRRAAIYKKLQREIYDDPPCIFLYAIYNIYGLRRNIEMTPRTDERVIVARIRRT